MQPEVCKSAFMFVFIAQNSHEPTFYTHLCEKGVFSHLCVSQCFLLCCMDSKAHTKTLLFMHML